MLMKIFHIIILLGISASIKTGMCTDPSNKVPPLELENYGTQPTLSLSMDWSEGDDNKNTQPLGDLMISPGKKELTRTKCGIAKLGEDPEDFCKRLLEKN